MRWGERERKTEREKTMRRREFETHMTLKERSKEYGR